MIFHENRLLADDSHEISYLFFTKIEENVAKFVVCCSPDWRFKGSRPSQQIFSCVMTVTCLPGLNQSSAADKVSCSSDSAGGESRTSYPWIPSLFQLSHCAPHHLLIALINSLHPDQPRCCWP